MELTIIGSGTAALTASRGPSGYILTVNNQRYLLDGGTGTLIKCLQAGISYRDIDKLFYTHLHPDHTIDLIPFLFASKYTPGYTRKKSLEIFGPIGFERFLQQLVELFAPSLMEVDYKLTVEELAKDRIRRDDVVIETGLMMHSRNAIGYRFELDGKVLVYSGDTDLCEAIIDLGRNADVLLLECSFPDDLKTAGHLTPSEAAIVAQRCKVRKLILTHLYPPCDEIDVESVVRRIFTGEVVVGRDMMTLVI